jgi:hypothetical protein
MLSAKERRQRAQDWLHLATTARDFFAQDALVRRAADCVDLARRRQNGMAGRLKEHSSGGNVTRAEQRALARQERWTCRGNTGAAPMRRL